MTLALDIAGALLCAGLLTAGLVLGGVSLAVERATGLEVRF